jgi:hypothetical protein
MLRGPPCHRLARLVIRYTVSGDPLSASAVTESSEEDEHEKHNQDDPKPGWHCPSFPAADLPFRVARKPPGPGDFPHGRTRGPKPRGSALKGMLIALEAEPGSFGL